MSNESIGRFVSKETQKILEDAERKNPDGIHIVIEENKNEQEHHDFEEVAKNEISLSKIFGESVLNNKEEMKMDEIKQNTEIEKKDKFVSFIVWSDNVFSIQNGKYYSLTLKSTESGAKLGKKLTILLRGNRLCKKQPQRHDLMSFWVFGDETFKVQEHVKNAETGEWQYLDAGTINATQLVAMLKNPAK